MKIDKVVFALNDNPTYDFFWKINKIIYKEIYGIEPILIYNSNFSCYKKSILYKDKNVLFLENKQGKKSFKKDWFVPWSLFYGATLFPNDVIMTSGIDQIPLSDLFFKEIKDISKNKYIIGIYDAYFTQKNLKNNLNTYPTSHHVGLGKKYKKIFNVSNDWHDEINKILNIKEKLIEEYPIYDKNLWGLDEAYSSHMINNYGNKKEFFYNFSFFKDKLQPNRVDRGTNCQFNLTHLKNGLHTEFHLPRPYTKYKDVIDYIIFERYGIKCQLL